MKLEWYIARRYLASRRGTRFLSLITLISMGGVAVGVMALTIVTAVMTGLQTEIREKVLGTNPHIWVLETGAGLRMDDWRTVLARVRSIPGVAASAPFTNAEVGLRTEGGYAEGALLRGIDTTRAGTPVTEIARKVRDGELPLGPTQSGYPPLLVGEGLARRTGLYPGSVVTLVALQSARMSPTGTPMVPMSRFEVVGSFATGMYQYDDDFMYTPLEAAQELARTPEAVSGIEVRVPEGVEAQEVAERVSAELGSRYYTQDWNTMNAVLFEALKLEKLAMGVILSLIVVVAAFNIISTLVMLVVEKTREIGILKAMGLTGAQVQRVFQLQGLVIGTAGSLLGMAGGLSFVWVQDRYHLITIPGEVYFLEYLPVIVDPVDVSVVLALSIVIAFAATIYPARQAARLVPIEAIRHD